MQDPSRQENLIDMTAALRRMGDDQELLDLLVQNFREDAPALLELLRQSAAEGDFAKVEFAAHKLKGLMGYFCAAPPRDLPIQVANAVEEPLRTVREGAPDSAAQLERGLAQVPRLEAVVRQVLETLAPGGRDAYT